MAKSDKNKKNEVKTAGIKLSEVGLGSNGMSLTAELAAIVLGPGGPVLQWKQYGQRDEMGDLLPVINDNGTAMETYGTLFEGFGIGLNHPGARTIDCVQKDFAKGLRTQVVVGNHVVVVNLFHNPEWRDFTKGDIDPKSRKKKGVVVGATGFYIIGGTHGSVELTPGRNKLETIRRFSLPNGGNWSEDAIITIGDGVKERNPRWNIKAGDLSGAINLTPQGSGNTPVILIGMPGGKVYPYQLGSAFPDNSPLYVSGGNNEIVVPFSRIQGFEKDLMPDLTIRRGLSTPQMKAESMGKYYLEVHNPRENGLWTRFPSDEQRTGNDKKFISGSWYTAWSFDGVNWFDGWTTKNRLADPNRGTITSDEKIEFSAPEEAPNSGSNSDAA